MNPKMNSGAVQPANSLADQLHQSLQKISIVNKEVRPERPSDDPYLSEARPPISAVTDLLEYELRVFVQL